MPKLISQMSRTLSGREGRKEGREEGRKGGREEGRKGERVVNYITIALFLRLSIPVTLPP